MKKLIVVACCMVIALVANCANAQDEQQACQPPPATDKTNGEGNTAQSCDPNEISGPEGQGEKRYVQQGEWMDYTIYFENKTNATAAAQEVFVDLPMDENLDWTTLELGEIAFGDHIDMSLSGKSHGKASYAMPGTNTFVKTEVKMKDGVLSWYMRDWDPTTADNFPASATGGFLPPNDPETHCGEGHLSYRVRVKSDAPDGAVIHASAQIVFDDNPMIETDPSWWNTVGAYAPDVSFVSAEVESDEGGNVEVHVSGGNADKASSVQVYLTYNTAAAADIDLKTGTVDGETPKGGLKFPLALSWAKGEIGEKVITIPVKTDKTVEDDEFFTLQLANVQGVELGENRVCTVTIRDLNDKTLKAAVTAYKPKKGETVATNSVTVASGDAKGGFVAGTGEYTGGSKLTLTAEARPGWAFKGWRLKDGGETILSDKAKWQVVVTNDAEYVAVFEKIPYVRGLADPADGGKVAGSGLCAAGKKVTLKATANKNFTFLGWTDSPVAIDSIREQSTAMEFVAKTPSLVIDRSAKPTANSKTSTTITNIAEDVTYYAVFKSYPEVFVTVEATDGTGAEPTGKGAGKYVAGTITGMGKYAIGKTKIALKATANKGYVFSGWYDANGELLTKDAIYTIAAMGDADVEYTAKFITAGEDKAAIAASVDGWALEPWVSKTETHAFATNVWAGVYLEWPVAAEALSATTVKVAGLPSGLKFAAKPVTSKVGMGKTAVIVTNVPANTIYGAPTAASKADKNGNVKPSEVKVTVTTAGKSSQTYQIDMVVEALPAWAQGTFVGDRVSLTVGAAGKVSGKAQGDGFAYTLAAPYYSGFDAVPGDEGLVSNFLADVAASWSYKEGSKTVKTNDVVRMIVQDNGIGGHASVTDWFEAYTVNWKIEPWNKLGKSFDKQTRTYAILSGGSFSEDKANIDAELGETVVGRVTLKFSANGSVSVAGEFVFGYDERKARYTTVKASGSATLVPVDEDHGVVFVYLTPKGLSPHARCLEVLWPKE